MPHKSGDPGESGKIADHPTVTMLVSRVVLSARAAFSSSSVQ